eukprot:m.62952 g.62952  ORF g.62952 m.62952 type:complete len:228 (-) comp11933_c0_seq3:2288-2971(-)
MDKFVTRHPGPLKIGGPSAGKKGKRQTTLMALKKVVVVEDIQRIKQELKTSENTEVLMEGLKQLEAKHLELSVLKRLRIANTVRKLMSHKHQQVKDLATLLVDRWKAKLREEKKPTIAVRFGGLDLKRIKYWNRQMAKAMYAARTSLPKESREAPVTQDDCDSLAILIVNAVVDASESKLVDEAFRNTCSAAAKLLWSRSTSHKMLSGTMTPAELVLLAKQRDERDK